jgi:hypothetical protein
MEPGSRVLDHQRTSAIATEFDVSGTHFEDFGGAEEGYLSAWDTESRTLELVIVQFCRKTQIGKNSLQAGMT